MMPADEDYPRYPRRVEVESGFLIAKGLALGVITALAVSLVLLVVAYYFDLGETRDIYHIVID